MKTGRPKASLALTAEEITALQQLGTDRSTRHGLATRARLILLSQDGLSNAAIAETLGLTHATVGKWRQRFLRDRLAGLHDALRHEITFQSLKSTHGSVLSLPRDDKFLV